LEAASPEQQRALAQTAHYFDYHLDPAIAQKGIRLTEPQVEILEIFKKEEGSMTTHPAITPILTTDPEASSVNGQETGAILHLRPQTLQRFQEVALELGLDSHEHDTLLSVLLNIYTKYRQLSFADHAPLYDEDYLATSPILEESHLVHETTEETMLEEHDPPEAANQKHFTSPASSSPSEEEEINLIWTHFHFSDALKQLITQALYISREQDFRTFLQRALEKEAQSLLAQAGPQQESNFSQYPTSQLAQLEDPLAIQEHIRRAVFTMIQYNMQAHPTDRWCIHERVIRELTGRPSSPIYDYLHTHQREITHHNTTYSLTLANNRKERPIQDIIRLAEAATAYPAQIFLLPYPPTTEEQ
jgi:hypothetical protein